MILQKTQRGYFMEKYYLYIVLTRTNTMISRLIQLVKKDKYTHAALALDKDLNTMYSFGRKYVFNPFLGRFRRERLDEGIYKFHKVLPGAVLEIEVTKEQHEKAISLLNQFINNSHIYKYNYKGLFHSLLKKEACADNRFLCSEFVYYVLNESGILDFHVSRNLVRPQDFLSLADRLIYQGDLKQLNY